MKIIKVKRGQSFKSQLENIHACREAREWVGRRSLRSAYRWCPRIDWMLWLMERIGADRKRLAKVLIAQCEVVLQYASPEMRRWGRGMLRACRSAVRYGEIGPVERYSSKHRCPSFSIESKDYNIGIALMEMWYHFPLSSYSSDAHVVGLYLSNAVRFGADPLSLITGKGEFARRERVLRRVIHKEFPVVEMQRLFNNPSAEER